MHVHIPLEEHCCDHFMSGNRRVVSITVPMGCCLCQFDHRFGRVQPLFNGLHEIKLCMPVPLPLGSNASSIFTWL